MTALPATPPLPQDDCPFTADELTQLRETFALSEADVELLLGGAAFIFEQAAYATTPPETLCSELMTVGVEEAPARAFGAAWQAGAVECVAALKDASVLAPQRLAGVDWNVCVATAASTGERSQSAQAILELRLETPKPVGEPARESIAVQLGVPEVASLLGKLDQIQTQYDKLV